MVFINKVKRLAPFGFHKDCNNEALYIDRGLNYDNAQKMKLMRNYLSFNDIIF